MDTRVSIVSQVSRMVPQRRAQLYTRDEFNPVSRTPQTAASVHQIAIPYSMNAARSRVRNWPPKAAASLFELTCFRWRLVEQAHKALVYDQLHLPAARIPAHYKKDRLYQLSHHKSPLSAPAQGYLPVIVIKFQARWHPF